MSLEKDIIKKTAIVIHIHYTDTAQTLADAISSSAIRNADLFITLTPEANKSIDLIKNIFPEAVIESFDNMGRDIRPFFLITNKYKITQKYDLILKLHGKKTIALPGYGAFWLIDSLNKLLPRTPDDILAIQKIIPQKGILGPSGHLFPYDSKTDKNHKYMEGILKSLQLDFPNGTDKAYFFGGSMLWFDAKQLKSFIDAVDLNLFPEEKGQYDGTLAHGVERAFTIGMCKHNNCKPSVVDLMHKSIREMDEVDVSIDGLIREYEEFSARAVLVSMGGKEYILDYKSLKLLQERHVKKKINSENAIRIMEQPDNVHTLLVKTQEELARIKASRKYRILEKASKIRHAINPKRLIK